MQQLARKRIVPDAARHGACRRMNLLDENIIASQRELLRSLKNLEAGD
jgi:hypothetical protein